MIMAIIEVIIVKVSVEVINNAPYATSISNGSTNSSEMNFNTLSINDLFSNDICELITSPIVIICIYWTKITIMETLEDGV